VTKYAFSQQRQVISLLEPTEFVTQLPLLSKPVIKQQRKCHDFGAVRKILSRSAGYFSFCGTEKSGQTQ
jgi:hypothetical protein